MLCVRGGGGGVYMKGTGRIIIRKNPSYFGGPGVNPQSP